MSPALADFLAHRGDPLAAARAAVRADPESGAAQLVEATLLVCSRDARDFEPAARAYARLTQLGLTVQQQTHVRAIRAALEGDLAGACRVYDEILAHTPHDLLALAAAQTFDYYLGNPASQLARTTRALESWQRTAPGYHVVLAMHAYALQECGAYEEAEAAAYRALALQPWDVRAHHAVAHVMEMQGRFEEGIRWLGARSALWTGAGAASTHLWWHIALYHLELGRPEQALAIYDHRMQGDSLSELIDASALLWRLQLAGAPLGKRFHALAAQWSPYAEDAYCAFNDLHAMMAFVGGQRPDDASRLLAALERRVARRSGANHDMTRLVGLPASRALAAFGRGDYSGAARLLRALPPVAHRIGGSHAQRDVLHLTRAAAAARSTGLGLRRAA
ncbi:MAG TPA: tetratricopeptide repeat protein [Burkholderiales bacterium]